MHPSDPEVAWFHSAADVILVIFISFGPWGFLQRLSSAPVIIAKLPAASKKINKTRLMSLCFSSSLRFFLNLRLIDYLVIRKRGNRNPLLLDAAVAPPAAIVIRGALICSGSFSFKSLVLTGCAAIVLELLSNFPFLWVFPDSSAIKNGKGLHSKKEVPIHRVADISGVCMSFTVNGIKRLSAYALWIDNGPAFVLL